mgnify:CR=1 FL=1
MINRFFSGPLLLRFLLFFAFFTLSITRCFAITNWENTTNKSDNLYWAFSSEAALLATIPGYGSVFACSAVAITPTLALTASHCVQEIKSAAPNATLSISFYSKIFCPGFTPTSALPGLCIKKFMTEKHIYKVTSFIPKDANSKTYTNDISILVNKSKAAFPRNISYPKFPGTALFNNINDSIKNSKVQVFGYTSRDKTPISKAVATTLFDNYQKLNSKEFVGFYVSEKPNGKIGDKNTAGICNGDSGGPAYLSLKNKLWFVGLTSNGGSQGVGTCTWPNYSTAVFAKPTLDFFQSLINSKQFDQLNSKQLDNWLKDAGSSY